MKINAEDYNDFDREDLVEHNISSGSLSPFTFLCLMIITIGLGLFFLHSATAYMAITKGLPHYYYALKQATFVGIGIAAWIILQKIPMKYISYLGLPSVLVSIIFLCLTVFSPYGVTTMGATRWLDLPLLPSFQPSEITKASLVLFLASWFSSDRAKKYIGWYYVIPIFTILLCVGLILLQKSFTTSMIVLGISCIMLLVCGIKFRYLLISALFMIVPVCCILLTEPYRVKRVFSFLFPNIDKSGINWQINNSLNAIAEGGMFGKGIGNGEYKKGLLPEIENDFIFANIAEEQGFLGVLLILSLFFFFCVLGYRAYMRAAKYDKFSAYLAFGITTLISLQASINICVVIGLLPPTGIPLPFFSLGGTNLLILIVLCGLLYKIMRENIKAYGKE